MKRLMILVFLLILSFTLASCNAKDTLPVGSLEYPLYEYDDEVIYSLLDMRDDLKYRDYIYISGVFDVDGIATIISYGYDVDENEYWVFGARTCDSCDYLSLMYMFDDIPFIIYKENDIYYIDYVFGINGLQGLILQDYSNSELFSEFVTDNFASYESVDEYFGGINEGVTTTTVVDDLIISVDDNNNISIELKE